MIKRFLSIVAIAALFAACNNAGTNENENESDSTTVEAAAEEIPVILITEFAEKAGNYVDKKVSVTGKVDHICKHGGKKIQLVANDVDIHVLGEEKFDEALTGSEITVIGTVTEFRIDEAYCLKMENDMIKEHSEGASNDEHEEAKKAQIQHYRDSMETTGVNHLSFYDLKYISHVEKK